MFRRISRTLAAALIVFVSLTGYAAADDGTHIAVTHIDADGFPTIRIVASILDAQGRPVRGLTAADLSISEGDVAQTATIELASKTSPVSLALVLDTSGSMVGRPLADAKSAMNSFIQSLGPADQAAVITFDATVRVAQGLTTDKAALVQATNGAVAAGNTAIYDAIASALTVLDKSAGSRRAIVLLTDGADNSSRTGVASALSALTAAQLPAYVVALGTSLDRPALASIAAASAGGQLIEAPTSAMLSAVYNDLSQQLLTEYSITYRSPSTAASGTTVAPVLTLKRGGTTLATAAASFRVPVRAPDPTTAPTAAPVIITPSPRPAPVSPALPTRIPAEVVALLGAATVLTLLLWVSELASRFPSRQRRRLEIFVRSLSLTPSAHSKRRSIIQRVLVPGLRSASRPLLRVTPAGVVSSTRERLQAAGDPMGLGPSEFLGVRAGLALMGMIVGVAITTALASSAGAAPFGAVGGVLLGYAIPGIVVDMLVRGRQNEIRRGLPSALDMLSLSAEAGLSFDGAIGQVAHRWNSALSDELRRLLVEFQMGRERRQALRELARRTGVADLERFTNAVIQADSLGVPLSGVLHDQASEMRIRRRQHAEEAARKAPVKMLFPMAFFIFPALFVVILGPAIPRLLEAFAAFK